jgi:hypothetical protein
MALGVEQQAREREREHLTQMLHFLCVLSRASVSIYRLAIPILFSNVFPHAENTLLFCVIVMNSEFEMRFAAALIALRAECILFSFTSNRFYSTHTDLRFFSYTSLHRHHIPGHGA